MNAPSGYDFINAKNVEFITQVSEMQKSTKGFFKYELRSFAIFKD